jgi:hypothetical protein
VSAEDYFRQQVVELRGRWAVRFFWDGERPAIALRAISQAYAQIPEPSERAEGWYRATAGELAARSALMDAKR